MDPPTRPRRKSAVDYIFLNDEYLARLGQSSIESSVDLGPEDSISQIASQSSSTGLAEEDHDLESLPISTASNSSQRTLEAKESKKLRYDQLMTCKHCQKWSIKDSSRSTSTTHIHGVPLGNDSESATQPTIMTTIVREKSHSLGRASKATVYCP
ncbi:hypothetical protein V1527DRAFT_517407 [Lipomyces starkeyi]